MENAVEKWREDLEFVMQYRMQEQIKTNVKWTDRY